MAGASVGTEAVRESLAPGSVSGALPSEPQAITGSNIVYTTHIRRAKTKFVIGHFSRLNSVLSNPGMAGLKQSLTFNCVTLAFLRRCG